MGRAALLARVAAHGGALHAVAAPAQGALLLTACTEGVLKVFDLLGMFFNYDGLTHGIMLNPRVEE